MEFERKKKVQIYLNIAPMIDVVFLLLLFFMLTSTFLRQPAIRLTLPGSKTARVQPEDNIVIFVAKDGSIYLNQSPILMERLLPELKVRVKKSRKRIVMIKADKESRLGIVVRIMDIAKEAGAKTLSITTRMEKKKF